jgi:phosphopantothenoylcysteine decarboxylase/phosphopantothenate--cysteine ligase
MQQRQENINKLKSYGYKIIGPEIGDMACGEYGEGKMTEPNNILEIVKNYFRKYK